MELMTMESTLLLAFSLGLLHALDADHIMAVSGLSARRPTFKSCLRFCYHWATGHGLALITIASAVYFFGIATPDLLSGLAESLVGGVLIAIGIWTLWEVFRRRLLLSFHHHKPNIHHFHWHKKDHNSLQEHSALLVGLLHGIAGSAPLLVLLPLSKVHSISMAIGYVLLFCMGVIFSMVIFGFLMAHGYRQLEKIGNKLVIVARALIAITSIGLGSHLIFRYL
ncbi:MAG: hypothetical protein QNK36_02620 [Colwellia sp.]|nr:hypothetical protein [Colwellia sp.]